MRLIDANVALHKVEQIPFIVNENKAFHEGCRYMQKKALRIFHESKAIDAVPVVRCKDCFCFEDGMVGWCNHWQTGTDGTGYCSYGELRSHHDSLCDQTEEEEQ